MSVLDWALVAVVAPRRVRVVQGLPRMMPLLILALY